MTDRELRDELEAAQERLSALARSRDAGFELEALRVQLASRRAELAARREALKARCLAASEEAERSQARLVDAMEGRAIDRHAMPRWEYALLRYVDGGRLFGACLGATLAGLSLAMLPLFSVSPAVLVPFAVLAAGLNGWSRGRDQRELPAPVVAISADAEPAPKDPRERTQRRR